MGTSTVENIRQNIYVDNVVTETNSVHEALGFYSESKKIFEGAAMNLRDWTSNNKEVLDKIPLYDQANRRKMKILGLLWHVEEDNMALTYHMSNNMTLSKRTVLSEIASIYMYVSYDPLGLFSPVTLHGKLFLQTLCLRKCLGTNTFQNRTKHNGMSSVRI